jgi:hypothetical protein
MKIQAKNGVSSAAQRRIGTKPVKVCAPRRNLALPAWRVFAL